MEQIDDCTACIGAVFGTRAIVVFFDGFDFLLLYLGTTGFACGFECEWATTVAIAEPGIVPNVFSSIVVFKCSSTGSSSDVDESSGKDGYNFGVFSTIYI